MLAVFRDIDDDDSVRLCIGCIKLQQNLELQFGVFRFNSSPGKCIYFCFCILRAWISSYQQSHDHRKVKYVARDPRGIPLCWTTQRRWTVLVSYETEWLHYCEQHRSGRLIVINIACNVMSVCRGYDSLVTLQCAAKKISPKVSCHFLSNHMEFLREILQVYYLFIYTQKRQAAFDCLQLLQSCRIFCVTT